MQKQVLEIVKDVRDSDVKRNVLNLQNVVDHIKLILENVDEINHIDYDYISALMNKSLLLRFVAIKFCASKFSLFLSSTFLFPL